MAATFFMRDVALLVSVDLPSLRSDRERHDAIFQATWGKGFHIKRLTFEPGRVTFEVLITEREADVISIRNALHEAVLGALEGMHTPISVESDGVHIG